MSPPREVNAASNSNITPRKYDVLFGRGRRFFAHPGNLRMLEIIQESKDIYNDSSKNEKKMLTRKTIEKIRNVEGGTHPPVRFLRLSPNGNGSFVEATRKQVHDKVAHCYREHKTKALKEISAIAERSASRHGTQEGVAGEDPPPQHQVVGEMERTFTDDHSSPPPPPNTTATTYTNANTNTASLPHGFFQQRGFYNYVPDLEHDDSCCAKSEAVRVEEEEISVMEEESYDYSEWMASEFSIPNCCSQEESVSSCYTDTSTEMGTVHGFVGRTTVVGGAVLSPDSDGHEANGRVYHNSCSKRAGESSRDCQSLSEEELLCHQLMGNDAGLFSSEVSLLSLVEDSSTNEEDSADSMIDDVHHHTMIDTDILCNGGDYAMGNGRDDAWTGATLAAFDTDEEEIMDHGQTNDDDDIFLLQEALDILLRDEEDSSYFTKKHQDQGTAPIVCM